MKLAVLASLIGSAAAFAPSTTSPRGSTIVKETKADLEALAADLNPLVKYYDPLKFGDFDEATIGWLRQSEIKHGRVAMAAFVGYVVQSNFVFPWPQNLAGGLAPSIDLTPEAQWDAVPIDAKAQIFTVIAFLEFFDETGGGGAIPHYMNGRKPGQYPSLRENFPIHFCLDLYDPFGIYKNRSEEGKARSLKAEINNGRLAMLGIFGFIVANKVPGSVPFLDSLGAAPGYVGNVMIPFEGQLSVVH